jgi:hypothetical protein
MATAALVLGACGGEHDDEATNGPALSTQSPGMDEELERQTSSPSGNACIISQSKCANHPQFSGTFEDMGAPGRADVNPMLCRHRAAEYAYWCGNPIGTTTTATFYRLPWGSAPPPGALPPGSVQITSKSYTMGNDCAITFHGPCANHPVPGHLHDFWGYAHANDYGTSDTSKTRCQQRGSEYLYWCGLRPGFRVTATFIQSGTATASFTVP